jgi:hypothetical protein
MMDPDKPWQYDASEKELLIVGDSTAGFAGTAEGSRSLQLPLGQITHEE